MNICSSTICDLFRTRATDDPVATLWQYVSGRVLDWANGSDGPVLWRSMSHRGVQWLDKVQFPRKQKRYIFSPKFEVRYDQTFEETIRACADLSREGKTWITEEYVRAMVALHAMGFAHSFEAWQDGKLAGGGFGVQLGSIMTCDSMFHRVSNASKAAYGQTLVLLRERGFKLVDTNGVAKHQVNYGEEWMPQWKFETLVVESLSDTPTLTGSHRPPPPLPPVIRTALPFLRIGRALVRRLPRRLTTAAPARLDAGASPGGPLRRSDATGA